MSSCFPFEILSLLNKQRNICTSSSRLNYVEWLKKKFTMRLMCLCQKLILVSDQSVVCTVFTSLLKYWLGSIGILTMCYWLLSTKYVNRWSFAVTGMNCGGLGAQGRSFGFVFGSKFCWYHQQFFSFVMHKVNPCFHVRKCARINLNTPSSPSLCLKFFYFKKWNPGKYFMTLLVYGSW